MRHRQAGLHFGRWHAHKWPFVRLHPKLSFFHKQKTYRIQAQPYILRCLKAQRLLYVSSTLDLSGSGRKVFPPICLVGTCPKVTASSMSNFYDKKSQDLQPIQGALMAKRRQDALTVSGVTIQLIDVIQIMFCK